MNPPPPPPPPGDKPEAAREQYSLGHGDTVVAFMSGRTAEREGEFLLKHLRPGMRVLDFGCGPGSITVGFARAVAPGEVVGIDAAPNVVDVARRAAAEAEVPNVRFEVANCYELPFADATFDAAFGSSVLKHLADPVKALKEIRRVLRPGGVIGVRDGDWSSRVMAPASPLVDEGLALLRQVNVSNGVDPDVGRKHRALLRAAGFSRAIGSATALAHGDAQPVAHAAGSWSGMLTAEPVVERIRELGLADPARLAEIFSAIWAWAKHPDAFAAMLMCEAVGWVE